MALAGFLYQLKKASQAQLFHSVTDTVDYSLAMPGKSSEDPLQSSVSYTNVLLTDLLRILTVLIFPIEFPGINKTEYFV